MFSIFKRPVTQQEVVLRDLSEEPLLLVSWGTCSDGSRDDDDDNKKKWERCPHRHHKHHYHYGSKCVCSCSSSSHSSHSSK